MFTGIVQAVGRISAVEPRSEGVQVAVDAGAFAEEDIAVGDSIALNGCCLTVVAIDAGTMPLTIVRDAGVRPLDGVGAVNLEKALRLSDRLADT
jgi:riboflavin synthase